MQTRMPPLEHPGCQGDSNSSFDVSEFKPRPITPFTIKNRLSKLGSHFKSIDEPEKPEQKKDKRKRLRKSISNWNFHTLGEKIKLFGNSTHDLGDQGTASPIKKQKAADTELLNDRKRKAEELYAQQYSTKKHKSNDGIPTPRVLHHSLAPLEAIDICTAYHHASNCTPPTGNIPSGRLPAC